LTLLSLTLSICVLAGQTDTPGAIKPPTDPPPSCSTTQTTDSTTEITDVATEIVLAVLELIYL
jgi:hypothetical protein